MCRHATWIAPDADVTTEVLQQKHTLVATLDSVRSPSAAMLAKTMS
jgi:hypothetical protein